MAKPERQQSSPRYRHPTWPARYWPPALRQRLPPAPEPQLLPRVLLPWVFLRWWALPLPAEALLWQTSYHSLPRSCRVSARQSRIEVSVSVPYTLLALNAACDGTLGYYHSP